MFATILEQNCLYMLGIIINTKSGKKAYLAQRAYLFGLLHERGEEYVYRITQYAGHATELAREMAEEMGIRKFLVLGGDGTISETINGLMQANIQDKSNLMFGLMPRGTGNDYGRYWKLTKNYRESLDRFFNGSPQPVDVGCIRYTVNGEQRTHYFLNSIGFGVDSLTCAMTSVLKYYVGSHSINYFFSLIAAVFKHKARLMNLKTDEGLELNEQLFSMNIGVGPYSGGGIRQNPDADPQDGIFHAMFVETPNLKQICHAVRHVFDGHLTDLDFIHTYTAKHILLDTQETDEKSGQKMNHFLYEADGILGDACGPLQIECIHHALQIIC